MVLLLFLYNARDVIPTLYSSDDDVISVTATLLILASVVQVCQPAMLFSGLIHNSALVCCPHVRYHTVGESNPIDLIIPRMCL